MCKSPHILACGWENSSIYVCFPELPSGRGLRLSTVVAMWVWFMTTLYWSFVLPCLSLMALLFVSWDNHPNILSSWNSRIWLRVCFSRTWTKTPAKGHSTQRGGDWEDPGAGHGEGWGDQSTVSGASTPDEAEGSRGQTMHTPVSPCVDSSHCGSNVAYTRWLKTHSLSYWHLWRPEDQNGCHWAKLRVLAVPCSSLEALEEKTFSACILGSWRPSTFQAAEVGGLSLYICHHWLPLFFPFPLLRMLVITLGTAPESRPKFHFEVCLFSTPWPCSPA